MIKALFFAFCLFSIESFGVDITREEVLEIGSFFDDKPLQYNFDLENRSQNRITDLKLATSCGCTSVEYTGDTIAPGGILRVNVESDLAGKRGTITKGIVATFKKDGVAFEKEFTLKFRVKKNVDAHQTANLKNTLFNENCGSCHAKPAEGKFGKALFVAVCAFCHGENAQGAMAKGFTHINYYRAFDIDHIRNVIEKGTPHGEMPGFAKAQGGPLDTEQIKTLIDYFQYLKAKITQ